MSKVKGVADNMFFFILMICGDELRRNEALSILYEAVMGCAGNDLP